MPAFDAGNLLMFVGNSVIILAGAAWALWFAGRNKSLIPFCLLLGGAISCIHEPLIDVIGHCFVPYSETWSAFSLYGRPITWWHPLAYAVFYGLLPALIYVRLRMGMAPKNIWLIMFIIVAFDLALEGAQVNAGAWTFYGDQPLTIGRMPLWWGAMNCTGILTTAVVVYFFDTYLRGLRALALALWVPIQHAAEVAIVGWPSWLVINSDVAPLVRQIGGVASFAIAFCICAVVIRLLQANQNTAASPSPSTQKAAV